MKKVLLIITAITLLIAGIMFAEYQYIMHNLDIYRGMGGTMYIEMFGDVHTYYVDYTINPEILKNN